MRLSFSWLGEFIDLGGRSPEQVAEALTMRTALIEGIERRGELGGGIVVGHVVERRQHPNADRLSLCQVATGGGVVEIVCGAPNVAAGQFVALAQAGSTLPNGVTLKQTRIRGVVSNGMICSAAELAIGEDSQGILVFEEGLEPGMPVREIAGFADVVFEIDNKSITHRPDLWGHEGFARELAAIYRLGFRPARTADGLRRAAGQAAVEVEIEARDLCGRYDALLVDAAEGVLGGQAPAALRRRLGHCGLRPLGLAVDLSNYVMLEIGQPTHPFDRSRLAEGRIVVRRSRDGERLTTLDGVERALPRGVLVIADGERPVALAGIMGGEGSGITAATCAMVLESAWFDAVAVRAAGTALGLRTDALARFEKSLDPAGAERGLRRYAELLGAAAPAARVAGEFVSRGEHGVAELELTLRTERARAKLGAAIGDEEMRDVFERLGFRADGAGGKLRIGVPSFRASRDVRCEDDLIEEVGRISGYERIAARLPLLPAQPAHLEPVSLAWRACVRVLCDRFGFAEAMSYPYVEDALLAWIGDSDGPWLRIRNPLQQGASRLRRSHLPWLLEFVDRNIKTVEDVRLFECGRVFLPRDGGADLPYEPLTLAAVQAERVTRKGRGGQLLRRLKGALDEVAAVLARQPEYDTGAGNAPAWCHPGRFGRVLSEGQPVGWIGQVHPRIAAGHGWTGEVAAFEIDLGRLLDGPPAGRAYRPPPRFPAVVVDVSFVAPFALSFAAAVQGIRACVDLLDDVALVDEYATQEMAAESRSLTLRLSFRDPERTLTDADVAARMCAVHKWLRDAGAAVRGDDAGA